MQKEEIEKRLREIEKEMADVSFWQSKESAQAIVREFNLLKEQLAGAGQYDKGDAILSILAGAGGVDAEDFARMLFEMYQKFAARRGIEIYLVHKNENDHGGLRNITAEVRGKNSPAGRTGVYGILKNESGVHRLVRVSPFSAKSLRHTSFALVEVIPKLPKTAAVEISEEELKIEFARSSGPGGQNVNKRETAVRVVHIPTGLTVHSERERSQAQNREKAIEILRGKLFRFREEERKKKEVGLYISKTVDIEWGSQIRSYVLHPYKLVKDHRTNFESNNPTAVLAGELDGFIEAELKIKD